MGAKYSHQVAISSIVRTVSADVQSNTERANGPRVRELCESRGGRPGLSVLMSLTVSVDVKQH